MEGDGIAVVLEELRSDHVSSQSGPSEDTVPSQRELDRLKRENEINCIDLLDNNGEMLKIIPLHAGRSWKHYDAVPEEIRIHRLPISNREFMRILDEAFEIST